jgi:ABC-type enterochelin transport system permease subunit
MSVCTESGDPSTDSNKAPGQIHCRNKSDDLYSRTVIYSILRQVFQTLSQIMDLLLNFRRFQLVVERQCVANLKHVNTGSIGPIGHLPDL